MTKHMPFQRTIVMLVALGLGIAGLSTPSWGGAALLYHNLEDTPAPTVPGIHVDPEGEIRFMRWYPPQLPVPMYFNDQAIPGRPAAQVFAVLSESLDRWTRVPESSFAWRNAGTTPITNAALDGVNVFTFVDFNIIPPNSPILGVTMWNFTRTPDANGPEGHFIDVDIVFSPFELWGLDDNTPPGQFNLLAVAVHELGHALGLSHHPNMGGIMFPVYQQAEVGQPFPFPDDSSIMSLLYPQDPPLSTAFGTIKGHVKDEAGNPIWNAWITAVREDGTRNPDGFDSVGAWSLLKGEYTLKRVPPGRYWLQMGPLVPSIRGNDTGLGGYGVYGSTFFNLLDRLNNVVGFVRVRRDYPVEWFDNIAEANANQPPFGATVLEVRAGQVYENIDFVVGIELPALPDVEPNNNFAEAILTTYGEVKAGRIDPIPAGINPDVDFYAFDAAVGDLFVVDVTALTPLLLPSPLKPRLTLYDPDGVVIVVRDAVGSEVLIPYRSPRAGRYYAKLEDQRGLGFGGPDYVYRLEVDLAVAHRLPEETNLLAPAKGPAAQDSEPVAVVGLDLVDNYGDAYGDAYISKVVAHFSNFSNRQMITPADFVPVALNELSGVSLWRDVNGDGSYNYTRGVRNDDDEFIPLSDIVVIPEPDGFTVEMYPQVAPDGTGSRAAICRAWTTEDGSITSWSSVRTT
ncbi:matrixin family metalloprotease [bacterium]|nr:matrixin family metalloprotease [bacterium]